MFLFLHRSKRHSFPQAHTFKVIPEFEACSHYFPLTYMALTMAKIISHSGHCPRRQPAKPQSCITYPHWLPHDTKSVTGWPCWSSNEESHHPSQTITGGMACPSQEPVSTHNCLGYTLALTAHRNVYNFLEITKDLEFHILVVGRAVASPALPSYRVQTSIPCASDLLPWVQRMLLKSQGPLSTTLSFFQSRCVKYFISAPP